MASSGEPVVLALYDLSQGMAAQMSQQFLGMQIDMIPHTGVVVYGKEYFFGGGIQALPHAQFVASHMPPVKMIPMGNTEIPKATFEEFLQNIRPRFTQQTYDLIRNNCNNFSDAVCQFLVGKSVPEEITGLPDRVFSSPMGQMLRPMVEQMQGSSAHQEFPDSRIRGWRRRRSSRRGATSAEPVGTSKRTSTGACRCFLESVVAHPGCCRGLLVVVRRGSSRFSCLGLESLGAYSGCTFRIRGCTRARADTTGTSSTTSHH